MIPEMINNFFLNHSIDDVKILKSQLVTTLADSDLRKP